MEDFLQKKKKKKKKKKRSFNKTKQKRVLVANCFRHKRKSFIGEYMEKNVAFVENFSQYKN